MKKAKHSYWTDDQRWDDGSWKDDYKDHYNASWHGNGWNSFNGCVPSGNDSQWHDYSHANQWDYKPWVPVKEEPQDDDYANASGWYQKPMVPVKEEQTDSDDAGQSLDYHQNGFVPAKQDLQQDAQAEQAHATPPSPEYDPFSIEWMAKANADVQQCPDGDWTHPAAFVTPVDDGATGGSGMHHPSDGQRPEAASSAGFQTVPPGCSPLEWQKSGWMSRCVLLIALWKKGHFNKMQEYMWKFSEHHTIKMQLMMLESSLQKFGPEVGPWKLGYNF